MSQAERDLGTKLDWVAVDHWNTEHPHLHVLVRGRSDTNEDLVISRDYISRGLRARAADLVTLELGPRTELELRRGLDAQVDADRWTNLDRALVTEVRDGIVDLRPDPFAVPDPLRETKIGRMRKLERLGLAEPVGAARWRLDAEVEPRLRALGERDDIIKRLHRSLGNDRSASLVLDGERQPTGVVGRLVARGLDDELARQRLRRSSRGSMARRIISGSTAWKRPATARLARSSSCGGLPTPRDSREPRSRCARTSALNNRSAQTAPPGSTGS